MKILTITPYFQPAFTYGGPIVSVGHLCAALHKEGQEITVLTTTANGEHELIVPTNSADYSNGYPVIYFRRKGFRSAFWAPSLLSRFRKSINEYDAVHIHTWWNFTAIPAILICYMNGIRPVLSPRGMLSNYSFGHRKSAIKGVFHRLLGRFLLGKTLLHATSLQEREECKNLLSGWPSFIAPNFIFFPETSNQTPKPKGRPLQLIFLSRIHEKKGLELMFEALAKVDFPFIFHIIGKGEQEYIDQLKVLALDLGLAPSIQWHSWVNEVDKYTLLEQVDLTVLPSYNENFANVVLESLSVGTPVLLSSGVGLSDYVREHNYGWVVSPESETFKHALMDIWKDPSKRSRIRTTAPAQIRSDFAPEKVVQIYLNAYKSVRTTQLTQ